MSVTPSESKQSGIKNSQNKSPLTFNDTSESLEDFLVKVLKQRFKSEPDKQKVDDSGMPEKLRVACPYCGDSKKKASKKRGNIFLKSNTFKCFNDGCFKYVSLKRFISHFCKQYSLIPPGIIFDDTKVDNTYKKRRNLFLEFLTNENTLQYLLTVDEFIDRFTLTRADKLNHSSKVFKYLDQRMITHSIDYGEYIYADEFDNKVYLVNFDRKSRKLLGFATRMLETNKDRKYILHDYNDLSSLFPGVALTEDSLLSVNFMNNYFNLLNIDFDKPITFVEGQFDSLFINNCAAVSGVSKTKSIFDNFDKESMKILFDNDAAGKNEMTRLLGDGYSVFLWSKCISDLKKKFFKDLRKIKKINDVNDLYGFLKQRIGNLNIDIFNEFVNKYYSGSKFDIFFI